MISAPEASDKKQIRILIIDDHAVMRSGLCLILESQPNLKVVGDTSDVSEALSLAAREKPHIILLDIDLGGINGLDLLPDLLARAPGARVLILTGVVDPPTHDRAMRLGAMGVVLKEKATEVLIKAIERVYQGEVWLDRSAIGRMFTEMTRQKENDPEALKINSLTKREREIITLIGEGLKNKEIGKRLFISETTVRHHLTSVFSKLSVKDRLELMIYAYRYGLAEPPR